MLTGPLIKSLNFDRCDHRVLGTCADATDGCCGVVACNLCIEITSDYTDEIVERKVAPFSNAGYVATLGNVVFEAYWRRDYTTDECVFIVEVTDAVETQVLEFSKCYDAACMAPAGSVSILYNDKPHVLTWKPLDVVTLKHRVEGKCKKPFCGDCTCAPREICVRLRVEDCEEGLLVGLDPSECKEEDPPLWNFTLSCDDYGVTVSGTAQLLRDEYTNECIINVLIPQYYIDYDYTWTGCPNLDEFSVEFTVETYSGEVDATLIIAGADCSECRSLRCTGCCDPEIEAAGSYLLTFVLNNETPLCACWNGYEIEIPYRGFTGISPVRECEPFWRGRAAPPGCPELPDNVLEAFFVCRGNETEGPHGIELGVVNSETGNVEGILFSVDATSVDCASETFIFSDSEEDNIIGSAVSVHGCGDATVDNPTPQFSLILTPIR